MKHIRVKKIGEGEAEHAIVGGLHGDEKCGEYAIRKLIESDLEFRKPVKLVIANKEAFDRNQRYVDVDLNRSFPGNHKSEMMEERIAAELMDRLKDCKILDLHATRSFGGEIFAAQADPGTEKLETIRSMGIGKLVYWEKNGIGCMNEHLNAVSVECGFQQSEQASRNALEVAKRFLAAEEIIDRKVEPANKLESFRAFEKVRAPGYKFIGENFKQVKKGEVYAEKGEEQLRANQSFYPVLMSTEGYEEILGHKAEKVDPENI